MLVVRISPRAQREIDEAFEWYRERSAIAARDFLDELDSALVRIADLNIIPSFAVGFDVC